MRPRWTNHGYKYPMASATIRSATAATAGTTLARAGGVTDARPVDVWRRKRDQLLADDARHASRWIMWLGAMFHVATLGVLYHADFPAWRVAACGGIYVTFLVMQRVLIRFARACERIDSAIIGINMSSQLFVVGCATLTAASTRRTCRA